MNPHLSLLVEAVIKSTVVLLAGGALVLMLARAAASLRHAVWLWALVAALMMPLLCALLPAWRALPGVAGQAVGAERAQVAAAEPFVHAATHGHDSVLPSQIPSNEQLGAAASTVRAPHTDTDLRAVRLQPISVTNSAMDWAMSFARSAGVGRLVFCGWLLGVCILLGRLVLSAAALQKLRRRCAPAESHEELLNDARATLRIRRRVELRLGAEHAMPMTWGIVRPVVLLPTAAASWPPRRVRMVLLHELAHVKRCDAAAQLVAQLAGAVYWFHPLVWIAAAGLRREQERAADDRVIGNESAAADYATLLLEIAAGRAPLGAGHCGAIAMAREAALEARLRAILDDSRPRAPLSGQAVFVSALLAAAIVLPIASLRAQTSASPATRPTTIPTQPAADRAGRFFGRVQTPDGLPVEGAEVARGLYGRDGTPDFPSVRAAADGSFLLPPRAGENLDYPWPIVARTPGWAATVETAKAGENATLHLVAPSSVRVVFLGPDGLPVVGLRVMPDRSTFNGLPISMVEDFRQFRQLIYPLGWAKDLARTTDNQGACTFDMLPQRAVTNFRTDDERYAQLARFRELAQTGAQPRSPDVTVHVEPGGAIAGTVKYAATGKPAAAVHVYVDTSDRRDSDMYGNAITNDRGEYRIAQLREGDYVLRPLFQDGAEWTAATVANLHVTKGRTLTGADIALIKGALVRGRVYEADSGKPFANASVMDRDTVSGNYCGTATDADGRYVLRIPPGGQAIYLAQQAPEGYFADGANPYTTHPLDVTDGQEITLDIPLRLKPGKTVSGQVVDEQGKPLADIPVNAVNLDDPDQGRYVRTDANGHFEFRGVTGFMRIRVINGEAGTLAPTNVNGGENDILLHVVPHAKTRITGTVVDTSGGPIANASIELSVKWGRFGLGSGGPSAITDTNGRFSLPGLSPGPEYRIHVVAKEFIDRTANLDFKPGANTYDLRVELRTIHGP